MWRLHEVTARPAEMRVLTSAFCWKAAHVLTGYRPRHGQALGRGWNLSRPSRFQNRFQLTAASLDTSCDGHRRHCRGNGRDFRSGCCRGAWIGLLAGRQQSKSEDARQRAVRAQTRRDERKAAYGVATNLIADWLWDAENPQPDYDVIQSFTKPFVHAANAVRIYSSDDARDAIDRFQEVPNRTAATRWAHEHGLVSTITELVEGGPSLNSRNVASRDRATDG